MESSRANKIAFYTTLFVLCTTAPSGYYLVTLVPHQLRIFGALFAAVPILSGIYFIRDVMSEER